LGICYRIWRYGSHFTLISKLYFHRVRELKNSHLERCELCYSPRDRSAPLVPRVVPRVSSAVDRVGGGWVTFSFSFFVDFLARRIGPVGQSKDLEIPRYYWGIRRAFGWAGAEMSRPTPYRQFIRMLHESPGAVTHFEEN